MLLLLSIFLLSFIPISFSLAPKGPWDSFNYAPQSRTVRPKSIRGTVGAVEGAHNLINSTNGLATLLGNSYVTVDFGIEVGGLVSLSILPSSKSAGLALSFTESPIFISPLTSDDSTTPSINMSYDGILHVPSPLSSGLWTQTSASLRGGFRFLTIISTTQDAVSISNITCSISFMPHVEDLRAYTGYFYAIDPVFHDKNFLTKLWYAGAYTVQTNTIAVDAGRQIPSVPSPGWQNNATVGIAGPIIVDGAKRDRAVWPGDMGVAVPTQFVSTNDLIASRNALSTLFSEINPITGALPESGPPLSQQGSDTYHAWTLIGAYNYFLYSGDTEWLQTIWSNYTKAVEFLEGKVDDTGLMNVTGLRDWARQGGGGYNSEGNALLYRVLVTSADLASQINQNDLSFAWSQNATALKTRFNQAFWLPSAGMYRDNETTTLCPQDANSMAIFFNLTTSQEQANSVSEGLTRNWNDLGPVCPELPDTISPFISSLEIQAHFLSGNDARAMDLIRREWGYMLYTNISVQSTLLEGFTANGSLGYRSYRGYNYDDSYTSHAHGWSSGPTSALTFYVLGLSVTSPQGRSWSFSPHLSGLSAAEGGFETPLGWFGAKWATSGAGLAIELNTPQATTGFIALPDVTDVSVDGRKVQLQADGTFTLRGGKHSVVAR